MENRIVKVEFVTTSMKTFVYLKLESEIAAIIPNTWEEGCSKELHLSLAQLMHLLSENLETEIDIDINVMLDVQTGSSFFKDVLSDVLTDASIEIVQRKRNAGSVYTDAAGNEVVATYNSIGIESFAVTSVTALGRFALSADTADESYRSLPERRNALRAQLAAKSAALKAAKAAKETKA